MEDANKAKEREKQALVPKMNPMEDSFDAEKVSRAECVHFCQKLITNFIYSILLSR